MQDQTAQPRKDAFGRPFLTEAEIQRIRLNKNRAPSRIILTQTSKDRIISQKETV